MQVGVPRRPLLTLPFQSYVDFLAYWHVELTAAQYFQMKKLPSCSEYHANATIPGTVE